MKTVEDLKTKRVELLSQVRRLDDAIALIEGLEFTQKRGPKYVSRRAIREVMREGVWYTAQELSDAIGRSCSITLCNWKPTRREWIQVDRSQTPIRYRRLTGLAEAAE
ncbi:MAG: hypothetical protein AAGE52_01505 [Myxococcota bacterium]